MKGFFPPEGQLHHRKTRTRTYTHISHKLLYSDIHIVPDSGVMIQAIYRTARTRSLSEASLNIILQFQ